jgi:hypothetical protein
MSMTEDFTAFFNTSDFAETSTFAAAPGTLIYDENGAVAEEFGVEVSGPAALCPVAQWPTLTEGDTIAIAFTTGSRIFQVRAVLPINDGALKLLRLVRI